MIAEEFGVSAQQARTDVRTYMEVAPCNAIEKGAGRKGYFPSTTFSPVLLGDNDLVWRATVEFQPPQAAHAQEIPLIHRAVHSHTLAIFVSNRTEGASKSDLCVNGKPGRHIPYTKPYGNYHR